MPRIFILRNVLLLRSVIIKEISGFNTLSSDRLYDIPNRHFLTTHASVNYSERKVSNVSRELVGLANSCWSVLSTYALNICTFAYVIYEYHILLIIVNLNTEETEMDNDDGLRSLEIHARAME